MVVAVKIPNHPNQKFFQCDGYLPIVSLDFVPDSSYPLRVG